MTAYLLSLYRIFVEVRARKYSIKLHIYNLRIIQIISYNSKTQITYKSFKTIQELAHI
jgi:hypothetical protein